MALSTASAEFSVLSSSSENDAVCAVQTIVHAGLDEAGSLSAATQLFTVATVITPRPYTVVNLIDRVALRSGKRLKRIRKSASELKWRNASQRIRSGVLTRLAQVDAEIFTLTVRKQRRRIKDTPENYAVLTCELLGLCWDRIISIIRGNVGRNGIPTSRITNPAYKCPNFLERYLGSISQRGAVTGSPFHVTSPSGRHEHFHPSPMTCRRCILDYTR